MKMGAIVMLFFCLEGCHRAVRDATPSTKTADSAAAAAPDTIKALPLDTVDRGVADSLDGGVADTVDRGVVDSLDGGKPDPVESRTRTAAGVSR